MTALIATGTGAVLTLLSPRVYASTTQFFVSTAGGDVAQLQQGNAFTQQRVKSYAQLLVTPSALDPVVSSLGLSTSATKLAEQVTATVPPGTVLIDVEVAGATPTQAAGVAKAIGATFPSVVAQIEQVRPGQDAPVKVTVVKEATLYPSPVSPQPARNLALAVVVGLHGGLGLALLRDKLDTTVKTTEDVESITDKAVIGGVAYDPEAPDHPLIVHVEPRSPRAEAFRSLRTNLQFINVAEPPRSLVVTSSVPGEGKTTTTANLAISLAQGGSKVCVVEGDLRRPKLLEYLGYEGAVGLTDVLIGRAEVGEVLQPFAGKGLWVLGAGAIPPNPSELLGTSTMCDLVEKLTEHFDYVLIDAPPLLPVTDAAVLPPSSTAHWWSSGQAWPRKAEVRHALDALEAVGGRVLGLILNRVPPRSGGGGYGSYSYEYLPETERERAKARRERLRS